MVLLANFDDALVALVWLGVGLVVCLRETSTYFNTLQHGQDQEVSELESSREVRDEKPIKRVQCTSTLYVYDKERKNTSFCLYWPIY